MEYRELGRTGWKVSSISFGAWAIGGTWGNVKDDESLAGLHRALDLGVNFFDTADVYGDGHSERLLAQLKRERSEKFYIATKMGRRLNPHVASGYNKENLIEFVEKHVKNSSETASPVMEVKEDIGLSNLRRQLQLLFKEYDLSVLQSGSVFTATLKINLASHV